MMNCISAIAGNSGCKHTNSQMFSNSMDRMPIRRGILIIHSLANRIDLGQRASIMAESGERINWKGVWTCLGPITELRESFSRDHWPQTTVPALVVRGRSSVVVVLKGTLLLRLSALGVSDKQ